MLGSDQNRKTLLLGVVTAILIWVVNSIAPAGLAVWIVLITVLGLLAKNITGRQVAWMTAVFGAVILAGYWTSPEILAPRFGIVNRVLGSTALIILAYQIISHKRANGLLAELKLAEKALKESEERLALAQRAGRVGIFDWDLVSGKAVWTSELEDIFGLQPGGFEGTFDGWTSRVHPDDLPGIQEKFRQWMRMRRSEIEFEYRFIRDDNEEVRWIEAKAHIDYLPDGTPARMVGTNLDITERKNIEQARADFLSMLTHDLKSPLTTIQGYSELLARICKTDRPEAMVMIDAILRSSEKMVRMTEDFLTVSKLESGKVTIHVAPENLSAALDRIARDFMPAAQKKNIQLETCYGNLTNACIDIKYIERSVSNLVQNALNHTPEGGRIVLKAESGFREGGTRRGAYLAITVEDTGTGIPEEYREQIFDRYFTVPKDGVDKGTGLGLAVVKAVAEAHGGRAAVESERGKGSAFHIYMPLRTECSQ